MGADFAPYKIALELEVGGSTIKDVVGFMASFELNGIPTATVQLAAGVSLSTGAVASATNGQLNSVPLRSPAKVIMKVTRGKNGGEENNPLAEGSYVIFDGYYTGTGWSRTRENTSFSVHLIHWLDDLNCSSTISGNYFCGMPSDMAQAATFRAINLSGLVDDGAGLHTLMIKGTDITRGIWEDNVKKIFEAFASASHFKEQTIAQNALNGNDQALKALAKMPCDGSAQTVLDLSGDPHIDTLKTSFEASLTHIITNNMGVNSFWNKLVGEIGAEFLLGVSPAAECANVIPMFTAQRKEYITITADEYNAASFMCNAPNLIESVDLFHPPNSQTGIEHPGVEPSVSGAYNPSFYNPFGRYPRSGADMRGLIMVKQPPRWMANGMPAGKILPETATLLTQDTHAGNIDQSPQPPRGKKDKKSGHGSFRGLADRYAEHWYKTSVLAQRQGELSGKLRVDIAPGSIVKIELPQTKYPDPKTYFGCALSVTLVINTESARTGTTMVLGGLRTDEENQNDLLTYNKVGQTPLYKTAWPGGPLAKTS